MTPALRSAALVLLALLPLDQAAAQSPAEFGACRPVAAASTTDAVIRSQYVTMSDGTRIAVDVHLPRDLAPGTRLPVIAQFTPYWRRSVGGGSNPLQLRWVRNGYAVVVADVRGTGASFGTWAMPWSPREVRDLGEIVAWIATAPWSNGRIGTIGGSYLGNTAQLAAVSGHSALRAVVPQFFDWDAYAEVVRFGGLPNTLYVKIWGEFMRQLNSNTSPSVAGGPSALARPGVAPVDGDSGVALLEAAVREHAKAAPFSATLERVEFRDDRMAGWDGLAMDDFLTFRVAGGLTRTKVPIFGWVGWQDGATPIGAISRYNTLKNVPQKLVIGPWNHGAFHHTSPYRPDDTPAEPSPQDQALEVLCWYEPFLKGNAAPARPEREVIYFTLGEERWHRTTVWPPAGTRMQRWFLAADGALSPRRDKAGAGTDRYQVDFSAATGRTSRWYSGLNAGDVVYPDRRQEDGKLLVYQSAPLAEDLVITGEPVITLSIRSTHPDGAVIAYLEDVDPSGHVRYLTEGALRILNRAEAKAPYAYSAPYHSHRRGAARPLAQDETALLRFGLVTTSVRLERGHRIRIALAGADADVYARLPADGTPTLTVDRAGRSFIDLPVAARRP